MQSMLSSLANSLVPWRREDPQPEPVLRIGVLKYETAPLRFLHIVSSPPSVPQWLMRSFYHIPDVVTHVDIASIRDPSQMVPRDIQDALRDPNSPGGMHFPTAEERSDPALSLELRLKSILSAPLDILLPGSHALMEWPGPLFPYQEDGVRTLIEHDRLLLADEMGLGKTIQVIAALRILIFRRSINSVLLVAPDSLLDQWRQEIQKWAPEIKFNIVRGNPTLRGWAWQDSSNVHVTIVSYNILLRDAGDPQSLARRKSWGIVIADEAQNIKNRDSQTSIALKAIDRSRSWAMTGTPIENSEDDLASIMEFVDYDSSNPEKRLTPGPELRNRHQALQLRRKKIDVLPDLPPKLHTNVRIELGPQQRQSYNNAEQEGIVHLKNLGRDVRIQHVLELITRLKQICNFDPKTGKSSKLDDMEERLEKMVEQGKRALVFSQYTSEDFGVEAVNRRLRRFGVLTFVGGMGGRRDEVIRRFRTSEEHNVLAISLRAGGVGLNLQEASWVFHLDRWWNPASEVQAEDRTHRPGQTNPVNVINYTCINTIEERIEMILEAKQNLFDLLVDDVSIDISKKLNSQELFNLFGLDSPVGATKLTTGRADVKTGLALEQRCEAVLKLKGYEVQITTRSNDGGIDLIAKQVDHIGIEQELLVQCKDYARPVGVEVVRELIGIRPNDRQVILVLAAPAGITATARKAAERGNVTIWDEDELSKLERTL